MTANPPRGGGAASRNRDDGDSDRYFQPLLQRFAEGSLDILLAGILRVADAFDAVAHPRPYQEDIAEPQRMRTLTDEVASSALS